MTTIYDAYTAPMSVCAWPVEDGRLWTYGTIDSGIAELSADNSPLVLHPVWSGDYTGFQAQWRIRHRLAYAAGLVEDDAGEEVWTDWSAWSASSGATSHAKAIWSWWDSLHYTAGHSIALAYDLSQYDMHEVEVRVRVYSVYYDRASEWSYGTTRIVMRPEMNSVTVEAMPDGSLSVEYGTNWPRGTRLEVTGFNIPNDAFVAYNRLSAPEGEALSIHRAYLARRASGDVPAGAAWVDHAVLSTADGAGSNQWFLGESKSAAATDGGCSLIADAAGGYVLAAGAHVDPQDVPVPVVTVLSEDADRVSLSIACACDNVIARAEWADEFGDVHTAEVAITGESPDWVATFEAPPYGVPVSVIMACLNATGEYRLATETVTVESESHCTLDGDGDRVVLTYDGEFDQSTDLDGESVMTVGRKLPVSRHGIGVSRDFSVKGTILFPSVFAAGDMELAALNILDNPHDWIFRNPRGMRRKVRVTSWSTSQDTGQLGRVAEVEIRMEEVD